jgi:hypothetical protein
VMIFGGLSGFLCMRRHLGGLPIGLCVGTNHRDRDRGPVCHDTGAADDG